MITNMDCDQLISSLMTVTNLNIHKKQVSNANN